MPKDFSKVTSNPGYTSRRATALAEEPAAPITEQEQEQPRPMHSAQEEAPQREKYSRHLQSLIKPSTYEAVAAKAKRKGLSVNQAVNEALEAYIQQQ